MFLVIGSTAARHYFDDWREPKDYDVFMDPESKVALSTHPDAFWHPSFYDYWPTYTRGFAMPDEQYTIKISHAYWELKNGSWQKHMDDAVQLKRRGASLIPELHSVLYKVWEEKHGKKRVDLDMDKAAFFDDAVPRVYDHDSVHDSVAYFHEPLYNRILKDGAEVGVSMAKLKALPFDLKVKLFREEIYATALERKVIPSGYDVSPRWAYDWALRRVITSLTKGWSATFIADNYELFRKPDVPYVDVHKSKSHLLVPYEKGK